MMETRPYLLHALSPLHAGTGQTAGAVDLPLARMTATGIPFVPGSSLKGVLRDKHRPRESDAADAKRRHDAAFGPTRRENGPPGDVDLDHAGALVAGDARLLALPVRSMAGTFALVTSPLLLSLARRDLAGGGFSGLPGPAPDFKAPEARVGRGSPNLYPPQGGERRLYLEELDLPAKEDPWVDAWAELLRRALPKEDADLLGKRLAVVDDETMDFLWQTATQVDARIRVNSETGTVAEGALWTEESLPAEALLVGLLAATPSHHPGCPLPAREVLDIALREPMDLQLGGKATIGRGRCRVYPWRKEATPPKGGGR